MTRMLVLRSLILVISFMLTGCMSNMAAKNTPDISEREVDTRLYSAIEELRYSTKSRSSDQEAFHRQLSLSFQQSDKTLTIKHEQIIQLFFQTIPVDQKLDIVISVAPASGEEQFKSLQNAWKRLRSLEQSISSYSSSIKLVFQPELKHDTALLQVVGGDSV